MAGGEKLSRYQEAAITALLTERTIAEAAAVAGVGERTLRRWLRENEGFIAAYRQARRRASEVAVAHLQRVAEKAAATLERNLECGDPNPEIRAANVVLTHILRGLEFYEINERLEALERRVEDGQF